MTGCPTANGCPDCDRHQRGRSMSGYREDFTIVTGTERDCWVEGPEIPKGERIPVVRVDTLTSRHFYGCARRGCDKVNAPWESYGAYGKSWCLGHPPLRVRIRRLLGEEC